MAETFFNSNSSEQEVKMKKLFAVLHGPFHERGSSIPGMGGWWQGST
jgi:hypothetical protein